MRAWMAGAGTIMLCMPVLVHGAGEAPDVAAQDESVTADADTTATPATAPDSPATRDENDPWLDRAQYGVFNAVWRSAMRVDKWFGSTEEAAAYQKARGSVAPAVLYDEFDGLQPRLRFQVDVPLPQINDRFRAFIGRVNPDEYVTEASPGSGAFARQYGPVEDDETYLGIRYRNPRPGSFFEADAGLRLATPLDPYVKGSWRFHHGDPEALLFSLRETAFWQNSEKFGLTSRFDFERVFESMWLLRFTGSGTFSQRTEGVRGYAAFNAIRGLPNRRAFCVEIFTEGEFDADVPLGDYGVKFAYRRSIARDWLVIEPRLSLTFPKEHPWQTREATWGVGIGLEMFFGTDQFLARPVTF